MPNIQEQKKILKDTFMQLNEKKRNILPMFWTQNDFSLYLFYMQNVYKQRRPTLLNG